MVLLRSVFLALLVLAVLPWGAFAGAQGTGGVNDAGLRQVIHPVRQAEAIIPQLAAEMPVRVAALVHRCRTATLPGAFCHPEMVTPPADLPPPPPGTRTYGWTLEGGWRTGAIPPVLKKPPRQI